MYQAGDRIIYGGSGVCQVKAVVPLEGSREDRLYYTLEPLYGSGIVYAPVDGPVFSRPLMTPEEVRDLLAQFPQIPAEPLAERSLTALKDHYVSVLKSHDCQALVGLIKGAYEKGRRAARRGKRPGAVDQRYLKSAQELLHGEIAAVLGIPLESVPDYIRAAVEGEADA